MVRPGRDLNPGHGGDSAAYWAAILPGLNLVIKQQVLNVSLV